MKKLFLYVAALFVSSSALVACANDSTSSSGESAPAVTVEQPVVRATDDMSMKNPETGKYMTGSFMTLTNSTNEDRTLIGGISDSAGLIEIHEVIDGEMKAMPDGLVVPANGSVKLRMGGYHVMLMELNNELIPGDEVSVTLKFDDGSEVSYTAPVKEIAMDDETYGREGGM